MSRAPAYDYRVIEMFLTSLNCARSLTILIMMREGMYVDIVNMEFNPLHYNDLISARDALLATELLRKHEDLPTNIDRASVALEKFAKAEQLCSEANERLRKHEAYGGYLHCARRKIESILGPFFADEMIEFGGWGPGSTLNIKRSEASVSNKFRREAELTPSLFYVVKQWFSSVYPTWKPNYLLTASNKVITVPKNAKTERTIAVEPSLNLYFQKGIGHMIRTRLARIGVDLNDQSKNQRLCAEGSTTGLLTTVDFSAASDTICWQIVYELLPSDWMEVLDLLRSRRGKLDGASFEYEKFSSMGNGFTFELESLIFLALAYAVVPKDHPLRSKVSVYGDDVIIPTDVYEEYTALCAYCGFTINSQKSFSFSYYRESCGAHYWNGSDITPIYLRRYLSQGTSGPTPKKRKSRVGKKVRAKKTNLEGMRFHNRVVELSRRTIGNGFRDKRFRGCINFLWSTRSHQSNGDLVCPAGFGDLGYIRSFDECCPVFHRAYQRGYRSRCIFEKTNSVEEDDDSLLLSKLYSLMKQGNNVSDVGTGNSVTYSLRRKQVKKSIWFPDWPSLGPWL